MLSVQSPSCAGMERLCAPTRTSLNTSADHHPMGRRILHQAGLQVRSSNASTGGNGGSGGHLYTAGGGVGANSHHGGSINVPSYQHQINRHSDILEYPHHVPLPDSEWGQDRHIQIRPHYQQTELTRTYIKPPPNKTVLDVPSNNIFLSSTSSSLSLSSSTSASCNYNNYNSDNNNFHHNHHQQQHHNHHHHQHHHPVHSQRTVTSSSLSGNNLSGANPAISSSKSKPNPIAKFFYRISNPKQSDHNTAASNGPSAAVGAASSSPSCGGGLVASRCSAPVTAGCYTATNNVMVYPSTPSLSYSFGGGGGSSVGGNSLSTTSSLGGASCPTATAATINLMPNQSPSLLLNSSSTNTSLASLQPKSSCSDNEYSGDTTTSMPANSNNLVADRGSGDSGTENINADTAAARNNCNNGRQSPPEGVHQV